MRFYVLAFHLLIILLHPLRAAEFPEPHDMEGQVRFLDEFLTQFKDSFQLHLVDSFEQELLYSPRANSTDLSDIRFLFKTPDKNAFEMEKNIIQKHIKKEISFERSLFIHTSFNLSGQHFQLLSHRPVALTGQLFRASLWVHSNHTYNTLSLLFNNAEGREIEVNLGRMNWFGWRRIDVRLPASLYRRGRNFQTRYRHSFKGFVIRSPTGRDPENASILIDHLLVLSNVKELSYPGAEILDNWK